MKPKHYIAVAVAGIAVFPIAGAIANAQAQTPEHAPYTSQVGVYVQSYNDDTVGQISCSHGGLTLVHGDGTLFMENTKAQTVYCVISIKKPRSS